MDLSEIEALPDLETGVEADRRPAEDQPARPYPVAEAMFRMTRRRGVAAQRDLEIWLDAELAVNRRFRKDEKDAAPVVDPAHGHPSGLAAAA